VHIITNSHATAQAPKLGGRLLWFGGIYVASVIVFGIVAFLLQSLVPS
jgi:hypothetical protein